MAASCAACLAPIAKGESFVLSGTEVFHRRCVSGIARSVRTELELKLIEARRELSMVREHWELAKGAQTTAAREVSAVRTEKYNLERDLRVARAARDAALRDSAYWQERAATADAATTGARDNTRAEITRLTADLAAAREAKPRDPDVAKDDRDATEIRFSLLELDKP